jgi:hypothetical protein
MTTYKAPLRDMQFVMRDLLNFEKHYQSLPACDEINQELIDAILGEASKFSEEVVAPLNAVGDETGCEMLENGEVRTPPGFKEAYQQYVDGGWPSLDQPSRYGGQDLPLSIGMTIREMAGTANWSWAMYSGLSHGAMETIEAHGSEEQKALFMEPLVSGRWTGTMCLTEAHCGTDLGLLKTKAEPAADSTFRITGSKLFVSSGEHDLAENIVHIVLARLPDAPPGTKGISLFIVPKFVPEEDGSIGERLCPARHRPAGTGALGTRFPELAGLRPRPPADAFAVGTQEPRRARRPDHRAPRRAPHAADAKSVRRRRPGADLLRHHPGRHTDKVRRPGSPGTCQPRPQLPDADHQGLPDGNGFRKREPGAAVLRRPRLYQ